MKKILQGFEVGKTYLSDYWGTKFQVLAITNHPIFGQSYTVKESDNRIHDHSTERGYDLEISGDKLIHPCGTEVIRQTTLCVYCPTCKKHQRAEVA